MLNSEKMLTAIQNQDLEQAQKYFEQALTEDDDQTLLALADYLQSIGFYPQAKEIFCNYGQIFLRLISIWLKLLMRMVTLMKLLCI